MIPISAERHRELVNNPLARLTMEEMADGWHFCQEFDWDLVRIATTGKRCDYCGTLRWELFPACTASTIVDQNYFEHLMIAVNPVPGYCHRFREDEPNRFGGWFQ